MTDTPKLERGNTLKRLVRSLSRSGRRQDATSPGVDEKPARSPAAGLSTSPPPDSYFPPPPVPTLNDPEATGTSRHPDSRGARASDVGDVSFSGGHAAPGVSFAPSNVPYRPRKDSDESWNPPPRRSQSVRRPAEGTNGNGSGAKLTRRGRAVSDSNGVRNGQDGAANGGPPAIAPGDRKGVQLEDTVLSRRTSVQRAASKMRQAVERSFVPQPRTDGEVRVLILVADGSEEIEVMTPYDIFVRASLNPVIVSVSPLFSPSQSLPYITLSRGAKILADTQFETLKQEYKDDFDAIIIPGGAKGAERLSQDKDVQALIQSFYVSNKLVGMICAGSLAAKTSGIALGQAITSHPSVKGDLEKHYDYVEDRVVRSRNLVTSRGPGTAMEWALEIVGILAGEKKRKEVEGPLMM